MRRLAAITAVVFVAILGLLAGRVKAGADPAQPVRSAAPVPRSTVQPADPYGTQDPYGDQPPPGGSQAAPGDGFDTPDEGATPSTHAS
jgi:hypothetical protein